MDIYLLIKALILGLVEGLTEFLPVSSTGHLIIVGSLLEFDDERAKVFDIAIQLGAILAVCFVYRRKITRVVSGLPSDPAARRFALNLLVAFAPALVLGLAFHKLIKTYLFSPVTVAVALIAGAFVILYVENFYRRRQTVESVDELRWPVALKVGLAQCVAMIPGVSRSGATIMGGLVFGLSRTAATELSFFLAIPTMFAATTYDVYKNWALLHAADLPIFAVGFVAAFLAGMLAVKALLHYIAHHSFTPFAWYRLVLGGVVLVYFW